MGNFVFFFFFWSWKTRFGGRKLYALWDPDTVTLGDLREAINTLEEMEPIARRVFGDAHPLTESIVWQLGQTRAAFRTREMLRRSG